MANLARPPDATTLMSRSNAVAVNYPHTGVQVEKFFFLARDFKGTYIVQCHLYLACHVVFSEACYIFLILFSWKASIHLEPT